jgi:predicted dehydrogenase
VVVGSRDPARAAGWATDNQVPLTASYQQTIEAADVDAVYIAVPNDQHCALAARAVAAGLASTDALGNARALDLVLAAAR